MKVHDGVFYSLFHHTPPPARSFTRIFSLLSRAQVQFLNALLSGTAQEESRSPPVPSRNGKKHASAAPPRRVLLLPCVLGAGGGRRRGQTGSPTTGCQPGTGRLWSRGSESAGVEASVPERRASPATADCAGVKLRDQGTCPPSVPLPCHRGHRGGWQLSLGLGDDTQAETTRKSL